MDRKSKPIKKQEKLISRNLKRKRIYLENENFDIMKILQQSIAERSSPKKQQKLKTPQKPVPANLFNDVPTIVYQAEEAKKIEQRPELRKVSTPTS